LLYSSTLTRITIKLNSGSNRLQGNVYLIGLMGAGKTTVGRKLSKLLLLDFIDTDQLLEQRTGVSISHIFEIEGEAGFRDRESRLLAEISEGRQAVVSTGGGVILRPENRQKMRKYGQVVYLQAPLSILWNRLKECQTRPLLQTEDPKTTLAKLMAQRDPLYAAEADLIVEVNSDSASKTARKIHQLLLKGN
jgi:shikimate kinase